jgi:hypothetical protein
MCAITHIKQALAAPEPGMCVTAHTGMLGFLPGLPRASSSPRYEGQGAAVLNPGSAPFIFIQAQQHTITLLASGKSAAKVD